ncbi:DUF3180 domain-containing protein [Pengzhenrongella sp.]|jgi:hypothetical protein|uniref:DUF3180 domain-containing protein n=1 Tax=Pengzhenrongella sp. TaxID=2888820 RepID=UPI002F91C046
MQRTRWQTLLLVAVVTTLLGWLLLHVLAGQGVDLPPVPWLVVVVLLVISGMVFRMGWAVRQFLKGKKPTLDPIRAARTAVLAKASSYTGSLLVGWYTAQVLLVLGDLDIASRRARGVAAAVAAVGALILAAVGLLVEWFCRVPPPTTSPKERAAQEPTDPAPA